MLKVISFFMRQSLLKRFLFILLLIPGVFIGGAIIGGLLNLILGTDAIFVYLYSGSLYEFPDEALKLYSKVFGLEAIFLTGSIMAFRSNRFILGLTLAVIVSILLLFFFPPEHTEMLSIQVAILVVAVLYSVLAPKGLWSHPRKIGYIVSYVLLLAGFEILIYDQTLPAPIEEGFSEAAENQVFGIDIDPVTLKKIRLTTPPSIDIKWDGTSWKGTVTFAFRSAGTGGESVNVEDPPAAILTLPSTAYAHDRVALESHRCAIYQVLYSCQLDIPADNRTVEFNLPFTWDPVSDRIRLGEYRIVSHLQASNPAIKPPPTLFITGSIRSAEISQVQPSNPRALRDRASWILSSEQTIELSIINRPKRAIAEQVVQIMLLAAGILIGLLTEPVTRPSSAPRAKENMLKSFIRLLDSEQYTDQRPVSKSVAQPVSSRRSPQATPSQPRERRDNSFVESLSSFVAICYLAISLIRRAWKRQA